MANLASILLVALSPEFTAFLAICTGVTLVGLLLKKLKQPYIVAYILTGILLGPSVTNVVSDVEMIETFGELGLIILMFFIGSEISLPDFVKKWKVALFGTGMQIFFSVMLTLGLGLVLDWSTNQIILLGFIISISSSAVIIKLLEDTGNKDSPMSRNVVSILLTQDILIAPMIIVITTLGGSEVDTGKILLQVIGGVLITAVFIYILRNKTITLPFSDILEGDHELQVFASLIICFGISLIVSLFELSAGLGAFVAGIIVHASKSTEWFHDSLHSFRVVLVSIFFVSIGMLIDLDFLVTNWSTVSILVLAVYLSNHGINALSLRLLGSSWRECFMGGALLAQIGEFSFVLAAVGFRSGMITSYGYQIAIIVIAVTIFISPFWVRLSDSLVRSRPGDALP